MPKIEKDLLKVKGSDGQWHYIPAVGGGDTPTWGAVQNKPFSTLGDGLEVDENGVLSVPEGGGGSANAVQYVAQLLTDEQKAQARENIGAKAATDKSAYIISKTRSYGYIHTMGMDFDGIYAQIQSGKVVMLLVDDISTYYGVIHPASGAGKEILFYNIADISDSGGRNKGIEYFGFTWRKGDDSLTEWWGDIPSVKVDETLTESGSAADAKAVGDALAEKAYTTDIPNVPAWAMADEKPTYTAAEVHALPDTTVIPSPYTLPQATADALGGIKADAATAEDTQDVRIGADGKLKTKPTGGSSITVDNALSPTSVNPVQNKVVTAALAEKITAPTTAAVGQIIKVKTVDDAGKPTEWEAADLPSGGGETWELIRTITTTEIVSRLTISQDESGKPFTLSKFVLGSKINITGLVGDGAANDSKVKIIVNDIVLGTENIMRNRPGAFSVKYELNPLYNKLDVSGADNINPVAKQSTIVDRGIADGVHSITLETLASNQMINEGLTLYLYGVRT